MSGVGYTNENIPSKKVEVFFHINFDSGYVKTVDIHTSDKQDLLLTDVEFTFSVNNPSQSDVCLLTLNTTPVSSIAAYTLWANRNDFATNVPVPGSIHYHSGDEQGLHMVAMTIPGTGLVSVSQSLNTIKIPDFICRQGHRLAVKAMRFNQLNGTAVYTRCLLKYVLNYDW